ncbi:hypothetical protein GQ457_18G015690 [Hibiscus cannabinus]
MSRFEEGRSISCPSLFEGEAYFQWSNVMKYFILTQDIEIWMIIEKGCKEAPKKKKNQMISRCKSAKDIWEKLEKLYYNKKEEKKDGVQSCANLLSSSKVDGVLALNVMKYFILAQDIEIWMIIEKCCKEALKKKKKQMRENDTKAKLNAKSMHTLLCVLIEEVSKQVSRCKSAKDI